MFIAISSMSRQHIEVKNGIWLLEKTTVIDSPWLHSCWLHGLSNDQGMTNFADGHRKNKREILLIWPKRRDAINHGPALHLGTCKELQVRRLRCGNHTHSGSYSRLVTFISNQSLRPSRAWKNTQWESDPRHYLSHTC